MVHNVISDPDQHQSGDFIMKPVDLLYAGKAKSVYRTDDPEVYIVKFRDVITL